MNERLPSLDGSSFELPTSAEDVEGLEHRLEKAKEQLDDRAVSDTKKSLTKVSTDTSMGSVASIVPADDTQPSDQSATENEVAEKVWVERVKGAIAQNSDNPYKQKQAISRVKADYMKTRFNMALKVDEAE